MCIRVERDPVGPEFADLSEGPAEGLGRLKRQAVDQIHIDRFEPDLAGGFDQLEHLLGRLHTMNRLLDRRIEVLHAKTEPVEPQSRQCLQSLIGHRAGIHLDGVFPPGHQREIAAQHGHEVFQLGVREEGGCAAPQVKLGHGMALAEVLDLKLDLAAEIAKVLGRPLVVLGDHLVAGAVVAHRLAERNVHVNRQRQRHGPGRTLFQCLDVVAFGKRLHEPVSGGIGGVTGTGHIEPLEQFV